jgi:hypothetical protein
MARNLDIPPPIKEENKAEYMLESAKLRDAEAWVAKHSEIEESDSATKQHITIKQPQSAEKSPAPVLFTLGFFIPCLIWMSLFAFLGEPCSVFCSGKEQWDVYAVILGNFIACGAILWIALFDAIGNKRFRSVIFFIGFASGSFIGLSLGGLFV